MIMGSSGVFYELSKTNSEYSLDGLTSEHDQIQDIVCSFISARADSAEWFWEYWDYCSLEIQEEGITFWFDDNDFPKSELTAYWTSLAFASERDALEETVSKHGFSIESDIDTKEIINNNCPHNYVTLRNQLWIPNSNLQLTPVAGRSTIDDLTKDEIDHIEAVVKSGQSEDALTATLLPSAAMNKFFMESISDNDSAAATLMFIRPVVNISDDLLHAAIKGAATLLPDHTSWASNQIETIASRANASAMHHIESGLDSSDTSMQAISLAALAGFEHEESQNLLRKYLKQGLHDNSPLLDVAASRIVALRLNAGEKEEFIDSLTTLLNKENIPSGDTRHQLLLATINLCIQDETVPKKVFEQWEKHKSDSMSDTAGLAAWATSLRDSGKR